TRPQVASFTLPVSRQARSTCWTSGSHSRRLRRFKKTASTRPYRRRASPVSRKCNSTPSIIFTSRIWKSSARLAARRCRRQPEERLRTLRQQDAPVRRDRRSGAPGGGGGHAPFV